MSLRIQSDLSNRNLLSQNHLSQEWIQRGNSTKRDLSYTCPFVCMTPPHPKTIQDFVAVLCTTGQQFSINIIELHQDTNRTLAHFELVKLLQTVK